MRLQFDSVAGPLALQVDKQDGALRITLPDNTERMVYAERISGDILLLEYDGVRTRIPFARSDDGIEFSYSGAVYSFTPSMPLTSSRSRTRHSSGELKAPMVGTVSAVLVQNGDEVKSYQPLIVIEAMKVLATLEAPFAGIVKLRVSKGKQVRHGEVLAEVVPLNEAGSGEGT
jgi:biotin carboxyl carrier protein